MLLSVVKFRFWNGVLSVFMWTSRTRSRRKGAKLTIAVLLAAVRPPAMEFELRLRVHEATSDRDHHGVRAVLGIQFAHDAFHARLDRVF